MFGYLDKTFCRESSCAYFGDGKNFCHRSLTEKVKRDAERWMKNPPIAVFAKTPTCYIEKTHGKS